VEYPDVLETTRTPLARYGSGGVAAALGERVLHLGFPFETIGDPAARTAAAEAALPALVPDYTPPELHGDEGGTDSGDPDAPGGTGGDTEAPPPAGGGGEERGCGCATPAGPGTASLALLGLLAWARRRR
jgi:uncharacterized protein (TIGR03382 family)